MSGPRRASARSPLRVLVTITLPLLLPGLVSGWLFAAMLSFNEFTASLFVTAQRTQTLPVAMYNYVREFADPSMAALSVMYIAATAALIIFANAYLGLGKVLNIEQSSLIRTPSARSGRRSRRRGPLRRRDQAIRRNHRA